MKKYTEEDFKKFEVDEYGHTICPSGDYTDIKQFPEGCSFGEWCSLGECCSFGEGCSFAKHCKIEGNKELEEMIKFEGFGSEHRCTYFFKLTDGKIYVRCGCFVGYIDEFREKVKKTHGDNKFAKEYVAVADLAEMHF